MKRIRVIVSLIYLLISITGFGQNITRPNILGPHGVRVNSFTGNMFYQRADLFMAGRMPFDISFSYNSADKYINNGYGRGWTFNYSSKYIETDSLVTVIRSDGRKDVFTAIPGNPGQFKAPSGIFDKLTKSGSIYQLLSKEGTKYIFNNAVHKRITRIEDRNNNGLSFSYTDSLVTTIADDAGRTIQLAYNAGNLSSIIEANGAPTRTLSYTYDNTGNLLKVTDPMGFTQEYGYVINGPMNTVTDRNGNTVDIVYNEAFAVKEIITCLTKQTIDYSPTSNTTHVTELVNNANQLTNYKFDANGNLVQKSGNCCGYNVKYEYDNNKNISKRTDANGNVYTYTYDAMGNMLSETDPLGHKMEYTYEPNFNNVASVKDKNGNTTTYTYDARGNLTHIAKPLSITEDYVYATNGDITKYTDPRGNSTNYTYNTYGNITAVQRPLSSTTLYSYDNKSRRLTESDPLSHTTTYVYDSLDRLKTVTDALNHNTGYVYDPNGNLIAKTDANNHSTTYTYDALDRNIKITDALGHDTKMTYDAKANLLAMTDANGNTTTYTYDALNRLITKANALNETTTYAYDGNANVIATHTPNGNNITVTYDGLNRVVKSTDLIGIIATYSYDNNGNILTEIDGNGNATTYAYDALNRVINTTDALGATLLKNYDKNGNVISSVDKSNHAAIFVYDELNRLKTSTDALNYTISFIYDVAGNLTSATDPNSHTTSYSYDELNRTVSQNYANASYKSFVYDAVGNITGKTDANGISTSYVYDALNRLSKRDYSGANDDIYAYDNAGRLLSANNSNATLSYVYDAADRMLNEVLNGRATSYNYNTLTKTRVINYPGGRTIKEIQNVRGELLSVTDGSATIAQFTYDVADRVTKIAYPVNGTNTVLSYDAIDRPTSRVSNPGSFLNFFSGYDNVGNKLYEKKLHNPAFSEQFIYDSQDRLVQYKKGSLTGNSIPSPSTQIQYNLDGLGNRINVDKNGSVTTYTTNNINGYASIAGATPIALTFDNNGNTTFDGTFNLGYDFNDLLIAVNSGTVAQYKYDALGRRISKKTASATINYFYDNFQIIEECNESNIVQASYVNGASIDEILTMDRGGNSYYYYYNSLGSVVALLNTSGGIVEKYEYDDYGNFIIYNNLDQIIPNSLAGNNFYFTGREYDTEINSYYYRSRHYSASLGRFTQRDPMGFADGFNEYLYAGSNPINFIDPLGTVKWGAVFTSTVGIIGNTAGVFGGVAIATSTGVTGVGAVVGGTIAVKSAYGLGANLGNLWNAFNDIEPTSTGSLFNDVAKAIDPCSGKLQALATGLDIATDLAGLGVNRTTQLAAREATQLAAERGVSVIGPRANYREFAKSIGVNFLDVTDEAWTMRKNVKFLQGVVKRGDDVIFAGNYNPARLDPKSVLAQEIRYLQRHGYSWTANFSKMVKK